MLGALDPVMLLHLLYLIVMAVAGVLDRQPAAAAAAAAVGPASADKGSKLSDSTGTVGPVSDVTRGGRASRLASRMVGRRYASLWRLRGFLVDYTWQMWVMFGAAFAMVAASTCIPLVMGAVVNGPIAHGDRAAMVPMFLLALGLGLAEVALIFVRRYVQSIAVLRVETDIRDTPLQAPAAPAVAFHDQWQTGQLLSRATTDLSSVRRFLGFGAIFLVVNVVQYVVVMCLLIATYPPLGLVVSAMTLPVVWLSRRFGSHYSTLVAPHAGPAGRPRDRRRGGRERHPRDEGVRPRTAPARAVRRGAHTVRSSSLEMVSLRGRFWALLELIPNIAMALVLLIGGIAVAHGAMSLGALVAFTTLLVAAAVADHRHRLDPVDGARGGDGGGPAATRCSTRSRRSPTRRSRSAGAQGRAAARSSTCRSASPTPTRRP